MKDQVVFYTNDGWEVYNILYFLKNELLPDGEDYHKYSSFFIPENIWFDEEKLHSSAEHGIEELELKIGNKIYKGFTFQCKRPWQDREDIIEAFKTPAVLILEALKRSK